MALIRDAIRIDGWARAQHATHTADVRPEWCPLCERGPEPPPTPAATVARPAKCQECGVYAATEQCAAVTCPQRSEPRMYPTAEAYIRGIRNAAKRAYAEAYARHMRHEGPEPERGALSYMAAQAVRIQLTSLGVTPPRPRYRLTPEGVIPCASTSAIASPSSLSSTLAPAALSASPSMTKALAPSNTASGHPTASDSPIQAPQPKPRARSPKATSGPRGSLASRRKRAGTLGALLDRLEAIGATFCPECYGYFAPDHTEHSWHGIRGPVVPVAHCTLAEPCVVDGIDGQAELVTIQEEREERAA